MGGFFSFLSVLAVLYLFIRVFAPCISVFISVVKTIVLLLIAAPVIMGLWFAVTNYVRAVRQNINFHNWEWTRDDEPAKRSYFFGPGHIQLMSAVQMMIKSNIESGEFLNDIAEEIRGSGYGVSGLVRDACSLGFLCLGHSSLWIMGAGFCIGLSLLYGSVLAAVTILMGMVCFVVWLMDHIYLLKNKIRSDCPVCHESHLIPMFRCPACGAMHRRLVPGSYGIRNHQCVCGRMLPAVFFNGRSELEAYCPGDGSPMAASDARPVVFQLAGGTKAGKTVYLAALFHEYLKKLADTPNLTCSVPKEYSSYFNELENWYQGMKCPATTQLNSQMYPILINSSLSIRRQISIYDIAGEMFDGFTAETEIPQRQFHYCSGILFLIDPFSSRKLREKRISAGKELPEFSPMAAEDVVSNYINYLIHTGYGKADARCTIPISVLIVKADEEEVKSVIDPAVIQAVFEKNPGRYGTFEAARDGVCRQFLLDLGLSAAVENLETQFTNLHYFPVSAMGHSADGRAYEPWGVMDAVEWMLSIADKELSDMIQNPVTAG